MLQSVYIKFEIEGDVSAVSFPQWIVAHGIKLGIDVINIQREENMLLVEASGPWEMLDALTIACLLGPSDVLVSDVRVQEKLVTA